MFFFVCVEGEESKVVEVLSMQSGKRKKRSDGAKFSPFFFFFVEFFSRMEKKDGRDDGRRQKRKRHRLIGLSCGEEGRRRVF